MTAAARSCLSAFSGASLSTLDGLEERAEVAGSKSLVALALDDLVEEGSGLALAVESRGLLEEDLQQVASRAVPVHQDLDMDHMERIGKEVREILKSQSLQK